MNNLNTVLNEEIHRNEELLDIYMAIPTGGVAAFAIRKDLELAKEAQLNNDVVDMACAYQILTKNV